jgi:hypothetical protein
MAQTYSIEKILLNYDKIPDGVDLSELDYEGLEMLREISEIKSELNELEIKPSKRTISNILAFSAGYQVMNTAQVHAELFIN